MARRLLEGEIGSVNVVGEITGYRPYSSGHWYFRLKDPEEGSEIAAVMFRGSQRGVNYSPVNGDLVEARGRVTIYGERGQYQIKLDTIDPFGEGALLKQFEALKRKLHDEGLFNAERKLEIPTPPNHIGIITSQSADALQDVCKVLSRRAALTPTTLVHSSVQGPAAPSELIAAFDRFEGYNNRSSKPVDLLLLVRGGGSITDLQAFNDEALVRRIAACSVPVITGVGHEPDTTLVDYVADRRAPTPSIAAEFASEAQAKWFDDLAYNSARLQQVITPLLDDARQKLDLLVTELEDSSGGLIRERRNSLNHLEQLLKAHNPAQQIATLRVELDATATKLHAHRPDLETRRMQLQHLFAQTNANMQRHVTDRTNQLAHLETTLSERHWKKPLERGYAIAHDRDGNVLTSAQAAAEHSRWEMTFHDGKVEVESHGSVSPSELLENADDTA